MVELPEGVPRVDRPLETAGVDPCTLLSREQQQQLSIDPDSQRTVSQPFAERCSWDLQYFAVVQASVGTQRQAGLASIYANQNNAVVFEPGSIDGYPLVRSELEASNDIDCTLYVGVADDGLIVATTAILDRSRPPCDVARQLASYMISNLAPRR